MRKQKKMWVYSPPKPPKVKVPDAVKAEVTAKAQELIESEIKPKHIQPPAEDQRFNYITDISTKWHQSFFYFCAIYTCPSPNALVPQFETRFARLQYMGDARFNLSYMRHTGQWWEIYTDSTLDECLAAIRDEPHFMP